MIDLAELSPDQGWVPKWTVPSDGAAPTGLPNFRS
jgi:hypothetical protein